MEIVCGACSTKLVIPDERLPKGVPVISGKCPKCQGAIEIRIPQPGDAAPAAQPPAPAPETPPQAAQPPLPEAKAPEAAPPPPEEDFKEGRRLAMACFDAAEQRAQVKAELETAGYVVHTPEKGEDAVHWLQRSKYELLILHEEFGGAPDKNAVLKALQPMAMALRRHMCVGLVGKEFKTFSNMTAFAKSVNFVVAERELPKISAIARQGVADNDQFYRVYREAMREAGKV